VKKIVEVISTVLANCSDESAASYSLFVEGKWCAWPLLPFRPVTEVTTITDSNLLCTVGCCASDKKIMPPKSLIQNGS
jgi:hypothetical protein